LKEYRISVDKRVMKSFRRVPEKHARQIQEALERLKVNPHPQDSIKLKTSGGYRVTVGEYRILYMIHEDTATVVVYLITRRNDFSY
jgi:mRNA-degrading endonuclease RelE of RelBE toxin-antitoxin system